MDERAGTGEVSASAGARFRLCTLGAQSSCTPQRTVPARGGEGAYRERNRTLGDYLFKPYQNPVPGDRQRAETRAGAVGDQRSSGCLPETTLGGLAAGAELGH